MDLQKGMILLNLYIMMFPQDIKAAISREK